MAEPPHEYDPERDGTLLTAGDVCALLHVSRSHLPNLRENGTLRAYQLFPKAHWRYPSLQPTLVEARAALANCGRAEATRRALQRRQPRPEDRA